MSPVPRKLFLATLLTTGLGAGLATVGTAAPMAVAPAIRTRVLYSETANLTYQLDVVGDVLGFDDPSDYRALWERRFLKDETDRRMLARWTAIRRRYDVSYELPGAAMPFGNAGRNVSVGDRLRIAGLRAESVAAFLDDAALLMTAADADGLGEVLRYFAPRFGAWWRTEAVGAGRAFVREMERSLASPPIRERIESFRRLYAPALPDGTVATFSLLYRPDLVPASTSGQQLGSVGAVEFVRGERVAKRLDVVLHEFCHFLYDSRPPEANAALQRRFAESGDPGAKPAFDLLNEGLATALGNGIVGRGFTTPGDWRATLAKPRSLYNNANIDRTGKRLIPLMDAWLPSGRSLDDPAFVDAYLRAMREEFGAGLTRPTFFLSEAYLYVPTRLGRPFLREMRRGLGVAGAYSQIADAPTPENLAEYRDAPNLSAVLVVPAAQIPALVTNGILTGEQGRAIQEEAMGRGSALFAFARSPHAHTFVIVTEDADAARRRVAQIAAAGEMLDGLIPAPTSATR